MNSPGINRVNEPNSPASRSENLAKENATKSNAIEIPSIALPKGGGALKGIDEKFQVNAANGTASYSIPLPVSPGRNGFMPALSLSYNSGTGNGPFGLGWDIGLPAIQRKTDKKLPRYRDATNEDIFMFSGAEDLVPLLAENNGDWENTERVIPNFIIKRYRPRIEGGFSKIEKIIHPAHGVYWKVTTRENVTILFGRSVACRIADPEDATRIFKWLPEFSFDDKGNWIAYQYKEDANKTLPQRDLIPAQPHEQNRKNGKALYTNLYLKRVQYGNRKPYYADPLQPFDPPLPQAPNETEHFFELVFDYGEHDLAKPLTTETDINGWGYRQDAFSNFNAGFEIRTTRLCRRVLMFHHFPDEKQPDGSAFGKNYLVRSLDIKYIPSSINNSGIAETTYLSLIQQSGYIRKGDGSYSKKSLPPLQFEYQQLTWNKKIKEVNPESLLHAPVGIMDNYQWVDFYGEGVSGIFTEQAEGWFYKHNLGTDDQGEFRMSAAKIIAPKPSFTGISDGRLQLQDLDANGEKQLVVDTPDIKGFFQLTDNNEWEGFRSFPQVPNIELRDSYVRKMDLNGDGMPELVKTTENDFQWWAGQGKKGYSEAELASKSFDEENGPAMVFAESLQSIFLADMSGDGLVDIVRIRNGEICYWPNKGYGKFGAKVNMSHAPVFDAPEQFNPAYLYLADISGTGATDILYIGKNKCSAWLNLSGNSWSAVNEIETFPPVQHTAQLAIVDLLGTGTACMVWSSDLPGDTQGSMCYIDLMSSKKPHVMLKHINNMGMETTVEYKSSTWFYLKDKQDGKPWITKLPFPVQVVYKSTVEEKITNTKFTTQYSYHHGYYDHAEKEFRGFGRVEQLDTEEYENWKIDTATTKLDNSAPLFQKPVLTKTWFHTGAFLDKEKILTQFEKEYWYNEMIREGFAVAVNEPMLPDAQIVPAAIVKDKSIIQKLNADEWREAMRACKGITIRQEVFALDAPDNRQLELTPYSVTTHNCHIQLLQPRGTNLHASFITTESESIQIHYERNIADPRIGHSLNIEIDDLGNIKQAASVVYPRVVVDNSLPAITQAAQALTTIVFTKSEFTNDVTSTDQAYRLRMPSEVQTFELKAVAKTGAIYSVSDFTGILDDAKSSSAAYHEQNKPLIAGKAQRRLVEHVRNCYLEDNLSGSLPLNKLESLGLPYQSYQLAYTPELLMDIFSAKQNDAALANLMKEGQFDHSIDEFGLEDANWWIRSGTTQFFELPDMANVVPGRFYTPVSYTDPFGSKTKVSYYNDYFLFIDQTEDALGNKAGAAVFNFRTLSPQRMRDINNNLSEVLIDELGLTKAMAIMGKGNQADDLTGLTDLTDTAETVVAKDFFHVPDTAQGVADSVALRTIANNLLQNATARFVYDLDAYQSGKPICVATILREKHFRMDNNSPIQISFEYTGGSGNVVMKKMQAEPGVAKKTIVNPDKSYVVSDEDTSKSVPKQLRWIGSGRTILNNKGNVVKKYEEYFSVTPRYEDLPELVETGVTPVLYYDAVGRLIKTRMPDGTFSRMEFDAWKQIAYDTNDTVLEKNCDWYIDRINGNINAKLIAANKDPVKEMQAAQKAAKHANTPTLQHLDTLGRTILSVDTNRDIVTNADKPYRTKIIIDIEGNVLSILDAREIAANGLMGNPVMEYKYDMLGHRVYQKSMDAGQRWLLTNVLGNPLRTWDERNHEFQYNYDKAHRPLYSRVTGGDGPALLDNIFDKIIYGESLLQANRSDEAVWQAKNVLGKPVKHFDTGGVVLTPEYDFKGQPISTTRALFEDYTAMVNWTDANLGSGLEPDTFTFSHTTDALGRIIEQIAPNGDIITPSYNETGQLNRQSVVHTSPAANTIYIQDIDYNEKGQRNRIIYGNDVYTNFYYDKETFRINRLETKQKDNTPLQDWYYTYDPVGNITHIEDKINAVKFYNNQPVSNLSEYTYDALYRLMAATGRENNAALLFEGKDNTDDAAFLQSLKPTDPMAIWGYTQKYVYDEVGNIREMNHQSGNAWKRTYEYEDDNNRLKSTTVGQGIKSFKFPYTYNAKHGFMVAMPHLDIMGWNFKEELISTIHQKVNTSNGTAETTYYQYDAQGQRLRKVTNNFARPGAQVTKKDERIYIAGFELYKKQIGNQDLKRVTLSLIDGAHRFVMVETRNGVDDGSLPKLVRYQLHNHLGSACLELNDNNLAPQIISYEEYHPYGTTAYQAMNKNIRATAKRYRYTGLERDEETGFGYHGARYYVPWLGRWASCDPSGPNDSVNLYIYTPCNPVNFKDLNGKNWISDKEVIEKSPFDANYFKALRDLRIGLITVDQFAKAYPRKPFNPNDPPPVIPGDPPRISPQRFAEQKRRQLEAVTSGVVGAFTVYRYEGAPLEIQTAAGELAANLGTMGLLVAGGAGGGSNANPIFNHPNEPEMQHGAPLEPVRVVVPEGYVALPPVPKSTGQRVTPEGVALRPKPLNDDQRAKQLASVLDDRARQGTAIAVVSTRRPDGTPGPRFISGTGPRLTPKRVRELFVGGEVLVPGGASPATGPNPHHGEPRAMGFARFMGFEPVSVGSSLNICGHCQLRIRAEYPFVDVQTPYRLHGKYGPVKPIR